MSNAAVPEYEQAVLSRLDRIATALDRLLLVALTSHDEIGRSVPARKALRELDRFDDLYDELEAARQVDRQAVRR